MPYGLFDLHGKVALVTGGNSGIGLGMAEALSQCGADVAIWGRDQGRLDAAVSMLSGYGTKVYAAAVDVSDADAVAAAVTDVVAKLGRIDAVYANAGIGHGGPFLDMTAEDYRAVLATNLDGVIWTLRETARHMVARAQAGDPGGSLVAISSLAAIEGAARSQAYAATKGAVISAIKAIAVEFARYGVRANAVLPGWITTGMSQTSHEDERFRAKVLTRVPLRRWGKPADFGGIAVYLASDASSYHSGDSIVIDGGYTIF